MTAAPSLLFTSIGGLYLAFPLPQVASVCEVHAPALAGKSETIRGFTGVSAGEEVPILDLRGWLGEFSPAANVAVVFRGAHSLFGIVVESILEAVPQHLVEKYELPSGMSELPPEVLTAWVVWEGLGAYVVDAEALELELMKAPIEASS